MSGNQAARYRMFGDVKQRFYIALFNNLTVRHYRATFPPHRLPDALPRPYHG